MNATKVFYSTSCIVTVGSRLLAGEIDQQAAIQLKSADDLSLTGYLLVGGVLICTAFVGGLFNVLRDDLTGARPILRTLLASLCATMLIPLFLDTLNSSIITDLIREPAPGSKLFTLMGFSLLAAIAANRFIDRLTATVFRRFEKMESSNEETKRAILQADARQDQTPVDLDESQQQIIDRPEAREILGVLKNTSKRYVSVLQLRPALSQAADLADRTLEALRDEGLIDALRYGSDVFWYLTGAGHQAARSMAISEGEN